MGVITFADEFALAVAPARLFKALVVDADNLFPKLMPQAIKSIEMIQGDGGVGSIKQINFAEGGESKYVKERVEEIDHLKLVSMYSVIEGDGMPKTLESTSFRIKFEAGADGGCVCKITTFYNTKGAFEIKDEDVKAGKEKIMLLYKAVEAYLLANPDAYA